MAMHIDEMKQKIRDIPDFPKPGIVFKDITPLLGDGRIFRGAIDLLADRYRPRKVDVVVSVEARGFILGSALAYALGAGNIIVRKPGKLPYRTHRNEYQLEYGTDALEIHQDAIQQGQRVLISDDVLATGGTVGAVVELVKRMGGEIVELSFLLELAFLKGRDRLAPHPVHSLIQY